MTVVPVFPAAMIYLIKRTASRLGDAVMLEPLISTVKAVRLRCSARNAFRETHPDDEIWVQVRDWIAPIFQSHPDVSRILPESSAVPQGAIRVLDIATDADCPWAKYAERFNPSITKSKQTIYGKLAGYEYDGRSPELYLNEEEEICSSQLRESFQGIRIGIQRRASESWRDYPQMEMLIKYLAKKTSWHLFVYDCDKVTAIEGTIQVVGKGLREVMWYIKAMDVFVGPDSGLLQISAALGVPTYGLFGATNPNIIFDGCGNHVFWNEKPRFCRRAYCWFTPCEQVWCLKLLSPRRILKDVRQLLHSVESVERNATIGLQPIRRGVAGVECTGRGRLPTSSDSTALEGSPSVADGGTPKRSLVRPQCDSNTATKSDSIAIMRLDGLGGTITLSDQARKIKERTGKEITLIIRHHPEIFENHPYVNHVITVGAIKWDECLQIYKDKFVALADVRMAIGKWYDSTNIFNQDFTGWESYYQSFPLNQQELSIYGLHHIQLTNKILGLPFEEIQSQVYFNLSLPEWFTEITSLFHTRCDSQSVVRDYICICPGIDTIHKGRMQTKCWPYWNELVEKIDMPVVQLGTEYDDKVAGSVDLRGKTTIREAGAVLSHASVVVTIEGGLMHLAHAVGQEKVVVLFGPTSGHLFLYPSHIHIDSFPCKGCFSMIENWAFECREGIDMICMKSITPARVLYACNRLLGRQSNEIVVSHTRV